jgi:GTP-binding protein EngB required for normal cell division
MTMDSHEAASGLNENHKRHLLISLQHVDGLLSDIESILAVSASKSPFPKYTPDITTAQARVVQDYMARIRAQILRVLAGQGLAPPLPRFGSIHSIRTTLLFIDSAIEELRPKYMRGYGQVPDAVKPELNGLATELQGLANKLNAYLAQGLGKDLEGRLARLERTSNEIGLLKLLEHVIGEQGLVEFREALSIILDRLEEQVFEIALFGRVSSGKSSLLNYLLGSQVLPVGVNPITAVPTRITYGAQPRLTVWLADKKPERHPVAHLADFVSEERNPANSKRVTRLVVELPAERLEAGVVFVDTPGLGSLATTGAAETLAYLPRCDMGVVLVDAGSTLTQEDLSTIRSLYEAGVRTLVLLSKADLLAEEDVRRSAAYISAQVEKQLGVKLHVRPISVRGEHARLLEDWIENDLAPLCERHKQLSEQSIRRKIGAFREAVVASLRLRLEKSEGRAEADPQAVRQSEAALRQAAGKIDETRVKCQRLTDEFGDLSPLALRYAAGRVTELGLGPSSGEREWIQAVQWAIQHAAVEHGKEIYGALEALAGGLTRGLRDAAEALRMNDAPSRQEMAAGLKEMPRLDLGSIRVDLRSAFRFSLGKNMTRKRIAHTLKRQIGAQVHRALSSYGHLLASWVSHSLAELSSRFDSRADAYRAQFERLAGTSTSGEPERKAIERSLAALAEWDTQQAAVGVPGDNAS